MGVPTFSFEDGTDSARRDALSRQSSELSAAKANEADVFDNAEVGGVPGVPRSALSTSGEWHPVGGAATNAKWQRKEETDFRVPTWCPRSEHLLLQRIATCQCDQFCFYLGALGLVFGIFRVGETWRSRKGCCI